MATDNHQNRDAVTSPGLDATHQIFFSTLQSGSAYARFSENRLGTLEDGKEADLAVLAQDMFSAVTGDLGKTRVVMTMVGGKVVFAATQ